MEVRAIYDLPELNSGKVTVFLVSKDNLLSSADLCKRLIGADVTFDPKRHAEKDFISFLPCRDGIVATIGLGDLQDAEDFRHVAYTAFSFAQKHKFETLVIIPTGDDSLQHYEALAEGLFLSQYHFSTYKTKKRPQFPLTVELVAGSELVEAALSRGKKIAEATCIARDLTNEPVVTLTARTLSKRISALGDKHGFQVEVMDKARISALKMGGLLAVNAGSVEPPTFNILEYKPKKPINKQPLILVGKGVVFDTGGLSLKPTAKSMDFMKADMAGAAAIVGAFCGMADLQLNLHVIGLIPATDNRPGVNAMAPSDVIRMYDGTTVEVMNTDAEGRLILADALAFAQQYAPELVIDLATLTGSSVMALGNEGIAMMSTAAPATKQALMASGEAVYERLVEFPLWKEYAEPLKSEIADLKNVGGNGADVIRAGKFLEHFTQYPWIHLDIAGASWLFSNHSYRGQQGTGVGVRLLINFISNYEQ